MARYSYTGDLRPTTKRKRSTIGRITPVQKIRNPYYPVSGSTTNSAQGGNILAQLSASRQADAAQKQIPSTQLQANWQGDPIYQRIQALSQMSLGQAQAEAQRARKQAVIETGITEGDLGVDENTLEAARTNPFSALAMLRQEAMQRERDMEEALNQQNLFYGGHRVDQLAELARNRAGAEAGLGSQLSGALGGINAQLAAAQFAEQQRLMEAELDAIYRTPPSEDPAAWEGGQQILSVPEMLAGDYSAGQQPVMLDPAIAAAAGVEPYLPTLEETIQYPGIDPLLQNPARLAELLAGYY